MVLLAYKGGVGRAAQSPPYASDGWVSVVRDSKALRDGLVAVDTFLCPVVAEEMPEIDPRTYELHDGRYSCYYDAVAKRVAVHSFIPPEAQTQCGVYGIKEWWRKTHGLEEVEGE